MGAERLLCPIVFEEGPEPGDNQGARHEGQETPGYGSTSQ